MSDPIEMPKSRGGRGGPFRFAMGCGCFFLVVMLGLVAFMTWQFQRAVTFDPARVRAAAQELLPGAQPLPGQVDLFAMEFQGTRLVVMGDAKLRPENSPAPGSTGAEVTTTYLTQSSATPDEVATRLRKAMEERGYRDRQGKVLKEGEVTFQHAGKPLKGKHMLMETESGKQVEEFTLSVPGPKGDVIAMFLAPEERISEADVQKFLDALTPAP